MAVAKKKLGTYLQFGAAETKHFSVTVDEKRLAKINAAAKKAKVSRSRWLIEAADLRLASKK